MSSPRILLVNPAPPDAKKGNNVTTDRWQRILEELGCTVTTANEYSGGEYDALVALHAHKSSDSIRRFAENRPDAPLMVALTGTDLYRDLEQSSRARESLERADCLVLLQPQGRDVLDEKHRSKTRVIHQSVSNVPKTPRRPESADDQFVALVVAHLRPIKDVLRVPYALRNLPDKSRVHGYHLGGVLDEEYAGTVREEASDNPRFTLLGEQSRERTLEYLKGAD
jgi:glycosyltransferase involved in cell wall biosynthesis